MLILKTRETRSPGLAPRTPAEGARPMEADMRWIGVLISSAIFVVTTAMYVAAPSGGSLYI